MQQLAMDTERVTRVGRVYVTRDLLLPPADRVLPPTTALIAQYIATPPLHALETDSATVMERALVQSALQELIAKNVLRTIFQWHSIAVFIVLQEQYAPIIFHVTRKVVARVQQALLFPIAPLVLLTTTEVTALHIAIPKKLAMEEERVETVGTVRAKRTTQVLCATLVFLITLVLIAKSSVMQPQRAMETESATLLESACALMTLSLVLCVTNAKGVITG